MNIETSIGIGYFSRDSKREVEIILKSNKKLKWIFGIILVVLILSGIGIYAYVNDYYHAEPSAREALESTEKVTVKTLTNHATAFEPMNLKAGVVLYPGGKVENIAYAPLMKQLAERDILAGSYGMQKNDGIPTVTPEEQQSITAEYISSCIDEKIKEQ